MTITSTGSEGVCLYSAEPWFGWQTVKPLPVYKVPFYLQANQSHNLWFPGHPDRHDVEGEGGMPRRRR